ncbi:MAG: DUF5615 family PIN-like protein [Polyangiaceae bacterium]|nr:DUF5615 family PIN-like protein [Polyangiaceae bacterium]
MNLPASLARALTEAGFPAAHVRERGLGAESDEAIVDHARERAEVIVTNDLDFGRILAVQGTSTPSVVVLRLRDVKPERIARVLAARLPAVSDVLMSGAIVSIDDGSVRIRALPVAGSPK